MPARTVLVVFAFMMFALLINSCSFGALTAPQPSPSPTRTRRPTATATVEDTSTPTDTPTATAADTDTPTAAPPTATDTEAPAATNTRAPVASGPTNTPRPRPPTLTFTPKPVPPTNTPALLFQLTFNWINPGRPFTQNECTFSNGTHIEGKVYRADGSLMVNERATAAMHLSIDESGKPPYAYPGDYKQFPTETDGRWNAEFPKWGSDFHWKIFISPPLSDDSISYDLTGVASASSKCGQPGTANFFVADWIVH